jgi:hypothetical protein
MEEEYHSDHENIDPKKTKRSERIHRTNNHINKQLKIVKVSGGNKRYLREPHRLAKHNAMDCGQPNCFLCGNPRKIFEVKTIQELKFEQTEKWIDDESEFNKLFQT